MNRRLTMARRPTPWLRKGRGWYVQIGGKQVFLGAEKDEAFGRFHALMLKGPEQPASAESLLAVLDAFLEWTQQHRAIATYQW